MTSSPRVLHVAGYMRSGTTLLTQLFGGCHNAVAVGETTGMWSAWAINRTCSCGHGVRECPLWGNVLSDLLEQSEACLADMNDMQDLARRVAHTRQSFRLERIRRSGCRLPPDIARYRQLTWQMYRSISRNSDGAVIVDSSKSPPLLPFGLLLDGIDISVIHVSRDPRGVAHSEYRTRDPRGDFAYNIPTGRSVGQSVAYWSIVNSLLINFGHKADYYRHVFYEDLVRHPGELIDELCGELGLESNPTTPVKAENHHIAVGNPLRLEPSAIAEIKEDRRWLDGLSKYQQKSVRAAGAPVSFALRRANRKSALSSRNSTG